MIPLSVPNLKGNESKYLKECVDTEWVSSVGKFVEEFEEQIIQYTKCTYAVACSSGTTALQLALIAAGVREGDEVIVPTMTFIASPNAVTYLNASPIFIDCDHYLNIDVTKLCDFLETKTETNSNFTFNKITGKRISAIMPVHVSGNAVDLEKIISICEKKNITIVEDAAEALGTFYTSGKLINKHAGTIGKVGCLSFNGNKIITSGGGGMVITDDKDIAIKVRHLSTQANIDNTKYIHDEVGYNYRLTNLQSAVGLAQLEKINKFVEKKRYINDFYKKELSDITELKVRPVPNYAQNNFWMSAIEVAPKDQEKLISFLARENIQTRPMWHLCHLQKPYRKNFCLQIENALKYQSSIINIPCSTGITNQQLVEVVTNIREYFKKNEK